MAALPRSMGSSDSIGSNSSSLLMEMQASLVMRLVSHPAATGRTASGCPVDVHGKLGQQQKPFKQLHDGR